MKAEPGKRFDLPQVLIAEAEALGLLDKKAPAEARTSEASLHTYLAEKDVRALCLSGGGIRSATFNLGVLQGLAKRGLLSKFDYLSTVSGGGYIGSWLSAAALRRRDGIAEVESELAELAKDMPDASPTSPPRSTTDQPGDIRRQRARAALDHLRRHGKYLSPRLGLFSPDTWALVSIYSRNLLLNWLVIVPLLAAALMVPRLLIGAELWVAKSGDTSAMVFTWRQWLGAIGMLSIGAAFVSAVGSLPSIDKRRAANLGGKRERDALRRFLLFCLTPLLVGTIAVTLAFAYDGPRTTLPSCWWFTWRGIAMGAFAGTLAMGRVDDTQSKARGPCELLFATVAGACAGASLWIFAEAFKQSMLAAQVAEAAPWWHVAYVIASVPAVLLALSAGGTIYIGASSRMPWVTDDDREWWARFGGWILICIMVWLGFSAIVVLVPAGLEWLWSQWPTWRTSLATGGGVVTIATTMLGFSADTPATADGSVAAGRPRWKQAVLRVAGPVVLLLLLSGLALGTSAALRAVGISGASHVEILANGDRWLPLYAMALIAIGLVAAVGIHLNRFSLHAIYRDRLIRAYLGAARPERRPQPFTGFDPCDNVYLHLLRRGHQPEPSPPPAEPTAKEKTTGPDDPEIGHSRSIDAATDRARRKCTRSPEPPAKQVEPERSSPVRPLHVVNMALNLVRSENNAWAERKADSFTATMLHVGNASLGYRDTAQYAGSDGLTLGTAMGISGAAVSPNMGYQSQPVLTFLLTLFNVRLGAWFGNPGPSGDATHATQSPPLGVLTLLWEALGRTTSRQRYVYLSDGGHFENLGLYEMVRRRCRTIVVSDASQDPRGGLEDLGNAVRKVRVDLGIPIEFPRLDLQPTDANGRVSRAHCAVGRIDYAAVDGKVDGKDAPPGTILYVKASLTGDEPVDVQDYARRCPSFPHETTANQFFTEEQFESYRALGQHVIDRLPPDPLQWARDEIDGGKSSVARAT